VGGKSNASGFDFSSGPAAQSASTGTADTLFGTEAAGASRSVFSSGANSSGFGAGSMNGGSMNGSSNGSISPTANGASHGRSRSQSAFGGLEGGIGGSPGISNGLHLDKGGFDKGHAGEHADSVRTWSGKDARRAASALSNSGLFSQQQAAATQSARKSTQRMARTHSVGNFARVDETEAERREGATADGASANKTQANNAIPRRDTNGTSNGSFTDDDIVRPAIWDVFGDTDAASGGAGSPNGSSQMNGTNGTSPKGERRSKKARRSSYVDSPSVVEAAASTPRRNKSGKPPRWVN